MSLSDSELKLRKEYENKADLETEKKNLLTFFKMDEVNNIESDTSDCFDMVLSDSESTISSESDSEICNCGSCYPFTPKRRTVRYFLNKDEREEDEHNKYIGNYYTIHKIERETESEKEDELDIIPSTVTRKEIDLKDKMLKEIKNRNIEYKLFKEKIKFTDVVKELKDKKYKLKYVKSKELNSNTKIRVKEWRKYSIDQHIKKGDSSWFHWFFGYVI